MTRYIVEQEQTQQLGRSPRRGGFYKVIDTQSKNIEMCFSVHEQYASIIAYALEALDAENNETSA
jgi:hypothetical protein